MFIRPPAAIGLRWFPVPREMIVLAVRWYLRYGLSYRDVEELLAERGAQVDHVTIHRWGRRFMPILAEAPALPGTRLGRDGRSMRLTAPELIHRAVQQVDPPTSDLDISFVGNPTP